jgi:diaminopimelate decarboxylase
MKNQSIILEQAQKYDSFYLYDESIILQYTNQLKECFPNVEFLYSLKTNPYPQVVKTVFSQGFGADAASLEEVRISHRNGLPKDKIYYSAPGKSMDDITEALEYSVIIADSLGEIYKIQDIAQKQDIIVPIGVRINPNFTFYAQEGIPAKFGIDEEIFFNQMKELKSLPNIKIVGIHVHSQSQELNADILKTYYTNMFQLAQTVQEKLEAPLEFINLGSGLGIPYAPEDAPLDVIQLGKFTANLLQQYQSFFPKTRIFIETGRYAVGKSGIYVTKVMDKKISRGVTYIILKNTLNGFIRPSLIPFVKGYSSQENPLPNEPLFTGKNAFELIPITNETKNETVILVGNLCTGSDIIAKDITLPTLHVGDVLAITNAGSYAAVLSPMQFSSQIPPAQLFLTVSGSIISM